MTNVILYTRVSTDEQADGMGRDARRDTYVHTV